MKRILIAAILMVSATAFAGSMTVKGTTDSIDRTIDVNKIDYQLTTEVSFMEGWTFDLISDLFSAKLKDADKDADKAMIMQADLLIAKNKNLAQTNRYCDALGALQGMTCRDDAVASSNKIVLTTTADAIKYKISNKSAVVLSLIGNLEESSDFGFESVKVLTGVPMTLVRDSAPENYQVIGDIFEKEGDVAETAIPQIEFTMVVKGAGKKIHPVDGTVYAKDIINLFVKVDSL